jgi:hypothetical protein
MTIKEHLTHIAVNSMEHEFFTSSAIPCKVNVHLIKSEMCFKRDI